MLDLSMASLWRLRQPRSLGESWLQVLVQKDRTDTSFPFPPILSHRASAKKWILKSQPDLVHTTLTPNSMVSLPEVLIEPYNPIGTFLETLAWRGLVVDEKSGKVSTARMTV